MTPDAAATDAAELVRFALDRRADPNRDERYRELLSRHQVDPAFRSLTQSILDGLGLRPLGQPSATAGLVVGAVDDGPFAMTATAVRERLRMGTSAADRQVAGVALAGIAAWCYPTATSVRDGGSRPVDAIKVDHLVRTHIRTVREGDTVLDDGLQEAWRAYEARHGLLLTEKGAVRVGCTVKVVDDALRLLAELGLLVEDARADLPHGGLKGFRPTDRFRAHVAATGAPLAWQAIAHSHAPDIADAELDAGLAAVDAREGDGT